MSCYCYRCGRRNLEKESLCRGCRSPLTVLDPSLLERFSNVDFRRRKEAEALLKKAQALRTSLQPVERESFAFRGRIDALRKENESLQGVKGSSSKREEARRKRAENQARIQALKPEWKKLRKRVLALEREAEERLRPDASAFLKEVLQSAEDPREIPLSKAYAKAISSILRGRRLVFGKSPLSFQDPSADAPSYHRECLSSARGQRERKVKSLEDAYRPKLSQSLSKGERERVEDELQSALSDEERRNASTVRSLGGVKEAKRALEDQRRYAEQAQVLLLSSPEECHAFVQYLHKRDEGAKERVDQGLCLSVIGIILLAIGAIFFLLSNKMSPTGYNTLHLDSFEFFVSAIGLSSGALSASGGLAFVLLESARRKRFKNAILYFRIAHGLFQ